MLMLDIFMVFRQDLLGFMEGCGLQNCTDIGARGIQFDFIPAFLSERWS